MKTVAVGFEPTMAALTERCLTAWLHHIGEVAGAGIEPAFETAYETAMPPGHIPARVTAAAGLEPAHSCLLDKRSLIRLSYAAKSGPGGTRTLTKSLQDSHAAFTSPARVEVKSDK